MKRYYLGTDRTGESSMKMGKGGKTSGNFGSTKTPKKSGLILSPAKPAGKSR